MTMGFLSAAGAGAGSFDPDRRHLAAPAGVAPSFAAGFINAGGSFGQFVFSPLMQAIISSAGWSLAMRWRRRRC
jgi:hypothetical protein